MTASTDTSFPLSGPINLIVRFGHGSVTVTTSDDFDTARVRLTPGKGDPRLLEQVVIEMRGPTLAIVGPRQGGLGDLFGAWARDRDRIDAEIDVPSGTAMKITSASAAIVVHGRSGGADITTASGDIDLDTVDGDLRVRSSSADLRVARVIGNATVRTGSGSVHVGELAGDLQSGFGSGDLEVTTARGNIRSRTGSGYARIGVAYGNVDLTSGSGELSVGLPAGVSARLDVTSGSGRVHSELPIEDNPTSKQSINVRARTGSGDVRLFRAAEAA